MRNKKGFTLIELLAVIVVLAIIALIATPIVMNTIKNAKKGSAERGADNYIKQVETKVATSKLDNNEVVDGIYKITSDGNICPLSGCGENDKNKITIEMNGEKPKSGTLVIKNGQIQTMSTILIDDYNISYNTSSNKYESRVTVYRSSTDTIKIGDVIDPNDTTKFTKNAATLEKNSYLKHVLDKDNKVTESYACGKVNDTELCLRGVSTDFYGFAETGEYDEYGNEIPDYEKFTGNSLIMKGLDGLSGYCNYHRENITCPTSSVSSVFFEANSEGWVDTVNMIDEVDYDVRCKVGGDDNSYCHIINI